MGWLGSRDQTFAPSVAIIGQRGPSNTAQRSSTILRKKREDKGFKIRIP